MRVLTSTRTDHFNQENCYLSNLSVLWTLNKQMALNKPFTLDLIVKIILQDM